MTDDSGPGDRLDIFVPSGVAIERAELEALTYESSPPRGFVHTRVVGTQAQHALLRGWVSGVPENRQAATLRFLVHVLASTPTALRRREGWGRWRGYVPVSALLIRKFARAADWKKLEEERILFVRGYYRVEQLSREFKVADACWRDYLEAGALDLTPLGFGGPAVRRKRVDLATGTHSTRRVKSDRSTPTHKPLPPMVRAAMDAVGPSPFNPAAIRDHLVRLKDVAKDSPADPSKRESAEARYRNDLACAEAVFRQGAVPLGAAGGLWEYRPAYRMQTTGRIGQKGGGLQSCSRAMKAAAYEGVPDVANYDLKSSQARILIALMGEAGVEPTWLRRYGDRERGKKEAADYVGISVDTWKECLYAALMGAYVVSVNRAAYSRGTVTTSIRRDVGHDAFDTAYGRFIRLTEDLHSELDRWHEHLVTGFLHAHGARNNIDGKTYVTNEVGAKVAAENLAEEGAPYRLKARLAAFLLQGREAAFTHALTASSTTFGFRVISHEHDGVVVVGTVPREAVDAAAREARLPGDLVEFVEKPFR